MRPLCGPLVQSTTRLSVFYFLVFIGMGLILANLGPVMPALIARLHVEVAVMGYIVAARALGYLLGCVLAGPMYDQYAASGNKLLSAGVVFAGLLNAAIPNVVSLLSLLGVLVLQGVAVGVFDTGCNVLMMRLHGKKVGPWLQAMHCFFAVGALVSPLIINDAMKRAGGGGQTFDFAFYGAAAYIVLTAIGPLTMDAPLGTDDDADAAGASGVVSGAAEWAVLILIGSNLFVYVGTETAFGAYVLTYSVEQLPQAFTESDGQYLTSVFWGAMACGRLLAIPLSTVTSSLAQLSFNYTCCIVAALWMHLRPQSAQALWGGTALFGLGMASSFPSALTLAQQYITLTGRAQGFISVMAGAGEILLPVVLAQLMQRAGAPVLMRAILVLSAAASALFLGANVAGKRTVMGRRAAAMGKRGFRDAAAASVVPAAGGAEAALPEGHGSAGERAGLLLGARTAGPADADG
jgi:fucose permease